MPLGVVFLSKLFFLVLWLKKEKRQKISEEQGEAV